MALEYGRMLLNIGFRAVTGLLPGGAIIHLTIEEFGPAFCEAAWDKFKGWNQSEKQAALEQLGQISTEEARKMAEEVVRTENIDASVRAQAIEYLAAIPMSARRTLVQGPGTPNSAALSLPATAVPTTKSDLLRFLPLRPPAFRPGASIPGHDYKLERLLGQGGFGEVWLATNPRRPRQAPRALKFCLDVPMRRSLERETDLLDRIEESEVHPGIVRLLQTALSNDPPFLVYEFVDGGDLTSWLVAQPEKKPDPRRVAALMLQVADALAFAHRLGLVHRDLKPSNVLIATGGTVKLTDFGIGAVVAEQELARASVDVQWTTRQAALQGACTPMYADRAQKRGEDVDARADIYAVGVMAYQLLLGDVALELSPYFRDELDAAGVPDNLIAVVASCLALPQRRLADGAALHAALEPVVRELLQGQPIPKAPVVEKKPTPPPIPTPEKKIELPRTVAPPPKAAETPPPPRPQPVVSQPEPRKVGRWRGKIAKGIGVSLAAMAILSLAVDGPGQEQLIMGVPGLSLYLWGLARAKAIGPTLERLIGFAGLVLSIAVVSWLDRPGDYRWKNRRLTGGYGVQTNQGKGDPSYSGSAGPSYSGSSSPDEDDDLPAERGGAVNLSGVWQAADGSGLSYQVQQQGGTVYLQELGMYGPTGGAGQGTLSGNQVDLQYRTSTGAMGRGLMQLSADGRQLSGTFTDFATGAVVPTMLYRP